MLAVVKEVGDRLRRDAAVADGGGQQVRAQDIAAGEVLVRPLTW